jgi:hypothetical protein
MKIDLNDEEARVLAQALESYLSDLGTEIAHTDSADFREGLKQRREILEGIAQSLREGGG